MWAIPGHRVFDDMFVGPIRGVRPVWTTSHRARLRDGDDMVLLHAGVSAKDVRLSSLTGHVGGILH